MAAKLRSNLLSSRLHVTVGDFELATISPGVSSGSGERGGGAVVRLSTSPISLTCDR